ncbi:uncharacterized protein [Narcine bancroftii]|uniref:uncharacterized protein n=1 Tax=Narcine bancroftii TaxID=1343680 RepID=UPI00383103D2
MFRMRCLQRLRARRQQLVVERCVERKRRRRRQMLLVNQLAMVTRRSLWRLNRPQDAEFWSNVLTKFDDAEWKRDFRMSHGTFHFVLELIEPHLKAHRPLEPGLRLAVALWWYATPYEYRSISTIFGIGVSTMCMVVQEVTAALRKFLGKHFISLPSGTRLQKTIDGFAQRGYPMCADAIDGSHIPIITPSVDAAAYYNCKGWHSFCKWWLTTDSGELSVY